MAGLEAHYSASEIEARILAALRNVGLDPGRPLSPEQLAPLDHFHTGGLRASREPMELAEIRAGDRVPDIGAGLGGPARMLAAEAACRCRSPTSPSTSSGCRTAANATPAAPGQLGLAVFVDDLGQKAANARRSLEQGQVRRVRGVFRRQAAQSGGGAPGAGSSIG